jgi:uncharacterized membrane protein
MQMLYETTRWAHILAGLAALVLFWVPALTRKGSDLHRRSGRAYVWAMGVVVVSAVPLSLRFLWLGKWVAGVFLAYLAVITFTSLWNGRMVLAHKQAPQAFYGPMYRMLGVLNLLSATAVLVVGLYTEVWLFVFFSPIGFIAAVEAWRKTRLPTTDPRYWWYEHLGGMIGTGIAAHVAFLNFGARYVIPGYSLDGAVGILAWLVPVVAGVIAAEWASRHYRRKFAGPLQV